jgi:hypothetical protein
MANTNGAQPHPNQHTTLERIRPDLNLEKWSIWQPAKSKSKPKERIIRREITLPDGGKMAAQVEVGFTNKGVLTTEDQKTFYALIRLWEERGRPTEQTFYSSRRLTKILKKGWGTNVIDSTSQSLIRLRITPFIWTNSYYDGAAKETKEVLDPFNILSDLKIIRKKTDGHVTQEFGYFQFNESIIRNLLANHTKPILLEVVLGFKSEIAQMLYTHLDLVMARRDYYERRTKELFDDLGLEGKSYRYPSNRKQRLQSALTELRGIPLSTGTLTSATIVKTKDGKDYKVVFEKNGQLELPGVMASPPEAPATNGSRGVEVLTPLDAKDTTSNNHLTTQARELVNHFHHVFHGVANHHISSKAINQAIALIARYGMDQARYVVDFTHQAVQETNFKMQHFGGIINYTSRAIADYEQSKLREKHKTAIRDCTLCDKNGFLTLEDVNKTITMSQCSHDAPRIHSYTQSRGVTLITPAPSSVQ